MGDLDSLKSYATCLCCLMDTPLHPLPCGHILCVSCIKDSGRLLDDYNYMLSSCPLHPSETKWSAPHFVRFKPDLAGVRVLSLDG